MPTIKKQTYNATSDAFERADFKVQLSADGSGDYVDVVAIDGTSITVDTLNVGTVDLVYHSTPPSLTNGQVSPIQGDSAGNLKTTLATPLPAGSNTIGAVNQGTSPWQVEEPSITGTVAITPSDSVTVSAARQFLVNCTVAGNVKVAFSNSSTLTIPVATGMTILPWAIIQVFVTGTTATATYANLS